MTVEINEPTRKQIITIEEMQGCIGRLKERLTYLDGSIVLYRNRATYLAMFSMDRTKRQESYFVRPDGEDNRKASSKALFQSQLDAVIDFGFVTTQERIQPDLLKRKPKPQTLRFADDAPYWESEKKRLSDLTLEHTVPILRFDLQWEPQGDRYGFAAALFADSQKKVLFELANR